ncbi:MAG: hypothetical protein RBU29_14800, partial [bacterium]|nr:hypothetical protein [bacterium]
YAESTASAIVSTYVAAGTVLKTGGDITINARTSNKAKSKADGITVGGLAIGASIAQANVGGSTTSYMAGRVEKGQNLIITATSLDSSIAEAFAAGGGLLSGVGADADAKISPTVQAYISGFVEVAKDVKLDATETPFADANSEGIAVSGLLSVGASLADAIVDPTVKAYVSPGSTIRTGQYLTGSPTLTFTADTRETTAQMEFITQVTATGVSLTLNATNGTILRNDGVTWASQGFGVGQILSLSGSTIAGNNGLYAITEINGSTLTVQRMEAGAMTTETTSAITAIAKIPGLIKRKDGGSWIADGFLAGREITVDGSGHNDGKYYIANVTSDTLTLASNSSLLQDETVTAEVAIKIDTLTRSTGTWGADGFSVGKLVSILGSEANDGIYRIDAISADGKTITLNTSGLVTNDSDQNVVMSLLKGNISGNPTLTFSSNAALQGTTNLTFNKTNNTLTRSSGSWIDDGFEVAQTLLYNGGSSDPNNGLYPIDSISAYGKTLYLTMMLGELTDKTVSSTSVSATAVRSDWIRRDTGSFVADGFEAGQLILVAGSNGNDGVFRVEEVREKALILVSQDNMVSEVTSNAAIIISGKEQGNLSVTAQVTLPTASGQESAYAEASGSSGSLLLGIVATESKAENKADVSAWVGLERGITTGTATELVIAGSTLISSAVDSVQEAKVDGYNGGIIAAGSNVGTVSTNTTSYAYVGGKVNLQAGTVQVAASGSSDGFADAISGSGGVVSGVSTEAKTNNTSVTKSEIRQGSTINARSVELLADHITLFNGTADSVNASVVGGSGAYTTHDVDSVVEIFVGDSDIEAMNFVADAANRTRKNALSGGGFNVVSGSGGVVDVPAAKSESVIDNSTKIIIGAGATIEVIGDPKSPGEFMLTALDDVYGRDKTKLDSGGAIAVANAKSIIKVGRGDSDANLTQIQIGDADLISVGDMNLSTRSVADIETSANSKTYGLAGAATGNSLSYVNADNKVIIETGANLKSEGEINLLAGRNSDLQFNEINATAYTDLYNKTLIPIPSDPDAHAEIRGDNRIEVQSGANLTSVKDTTLFADMGEFTAIGEGTGKDLYKELASEVASAVSNLFGGDDVSFELVGGSTDTDHISEHVVVNGNITAGVNNKWNIEITENQTVIFRDANGQIINDPDVKYYRTVEPLGEAILKRIKDLESLQASYSGNPDAVAGYQSEIDFLKRQLLDMNLAEERVRNGQTIIVPIEGVEVDFITFEDIWAQSANVNLKGDHISGSGRVEAKGDALIQIINNSPAFLRLNDLTIPDHAGGQVLWNNSSITSLPGMTIIAPGDDRHP